MKNLASTLACTACLLLAAPQALADDERVVPPWKRGVSRAPRSSADTHPPAEIPSMLRRSSVATEKTARDLDDLQRRIVADAREAARDQADSRGRRTYFRVGFRQGMLDALNDARIGRFEFRQGKLDGTTDREARRIGRGLGSDAAVEIALREAESAVAAQFRDLSFEPVFDPAPVTPAWAAPPVVFDVPDVDELLAEYPFNSFGPRVRDDEGFLEDWDWNAKRLRRSKHHGDVYDRAWDDAGRAFDRWMRHPRNTRMLRGLPAVEREALRALYMETFARRIDRLAETRLAAAWERGLDRGWDYGRFIREELEYRRGFASGFRLQASLAAKNVFRSAYPREFEASYDAAFDRWSTRAVPAIGRIELVDGNNDGVFEPGERFSVDIEVINFGGASGRFDTGVAGGALALSDTTTVDLPRRSAVTRRALLEAGIDDSVRPRTRSELEVRLGDETKIVGLRVARPLEWVRESLRVTRDNLAGRVDVELDVRNISRRALRPAATLSGPDGAEIAPLAALPTIRANDRVGVRFELEDLSPLALIAGRVSLDLFLDAEGIEQDRTSTKLPGTATDLSSRDLPRLVRRMATRGATPAEAAQVRELVLLRLRADWRAAVRANGNPYKRDYRSGGDLTALGELVSLSRTSGRTDLLQGLSSDVLVLSKDLPGPHPLLRKYVRRLAQRLP